MKDTPTDTGTPARFLVGIDLGTTNCAVAYADTPARSGRVEIFPILQLTAPGTSERRNILPSFHLEPAAGQFDEVSLRLPWDESDARSRPIVGVLAREQGADAPGRLIVSAKSWLSHSGVDRTADLLPWHGTDDVAKISPAEAGARYLRHIRAAWDHEHPDARLETQDVIITIPASFDETARELTVDAARRAGLRRVVLIEEPQAAFYTWMNRGDQSTSLPVGKIVLVCDVGGGTSDFSLIEAKGGEGGGGRFHRFAVGDHLILGGDNLDLAIAHHVETRLPTPLEPRAWSALVRRCQQAKEILLGPDAPDRIGISVSAGGARLLRGARQVELDREEVTALLLDGFLPMVSPDAAPERHGSGFQEFGLPYAPDAAITRYLAVFLRRQPPVGRQLIRGLVRPDAILFNGGFFRSSILRARLLEVMQDWFGAEWQPDLLENPQPDLAVAEGAVRFGLARRGEGARVGGGLARAYYLGVTGQDGQRFALCLAPAGMAEEQQTDVEAPFELLIRQPVEFPLYTSTFRTGDAAGTLVPLGPAGGAEEFVALAPLRTALQGRMAEGGENRVPVRLHSRLSAVGTLDIWCSEAGGRRRQWKLPFDLRAGSPLLTTGPLPTFSPDEEILLRCRSRIQSVFGGEAAAGTAAVESLVKRLEEDSGLGRLDWPLPLLRALWQELMDVESARARSPGHEARWLNLLGFSLRPGFGFPVDDWRCAQTWRLYERRLTHGRNELCRAEWWVLWRRIAGGLTAGQQQALAAPLLAAIGKENAGASHETAETWRLLGSLERLPSDVKIRLGASFLDRLARPLTTDLHKALVWAVGRLGARVPLHGPLNALVQPGEVQRWLERLLLLPERGEELSFAIAQMSRRTGDRFREIEPALREKITAWMELHGSPGHLEWVARGGELSETARDRAFGERLPLGLRVPG